MTSRKQQVFSGLILLLALGIGAGTAWGQPPSITRISPTGAAPGSTVDITLYGSNLNGATQLWTSFPAQVTLPDDIEDNAQQPSQVVYRLEIPADVPPGIGGVRVATEQGVSDLRLFMIDDLPDVPEQEPNNSPGEPQEITPPVAISGTIDPEQYDYYQLHARKGQRIAFEVVARRLGSPMDPLVRILDSQGREVVYQDDSQGVGSDTRFLYTFPNDADYLVEIRDIRYQGGENYFYRLRVADFPIVTAAYPMGGRRGSRIEVTFAGDHLEGVVPRVLELLSDPLVEQIWVGVKGGRSQGSGFVPLALGSGAEVLEAEPNNLADQATRISVPVTINGRLGQPEDQDQWVFSATKGQRLVFEAITRQLGSPADLYLMLFNTKGDQLATADDSGRADAVLDFTVPEDGDYRLVVEDLTRRGGPGFVYRIAVRPFEPGFRLLPKAQKLDVPQGGVASIEVKVERRDYTGPISVKAEGLPSGVTASQTTIASGQDESVMTLAASNEVSPGQLIVWRLVGSAEVNGQPIAAAADLSDVLRGTMADMPWPPQSLVRDLAIGIGLKPFFTLSADPQRLIVGRNLSATLTVKARRDEGFQDSIEITTANLPEKVKAEVKPIEAEKDSVGIVFRAEADAPLGVYTALVSGKGKFQVLEITQPAPVIFLEIRSAFELKADVGEGQLARGGKLPVKVTVERHGYDGPVQLELRNLPQGVNPPTEMVVPEGANELEMELTAADDAQVGLAENVTLVGKAEVNGAAQEATAPAFSLNVIEKPAQ